MKLTSLSLVKSLHTILINDNDHHLLGKEKKSFIKMNKNNKKL